MSVRGRVVDERTLEPLAFVNISLIDAREGAMTDIDGRFAINVPVLPATLRFSYVGYHTVDVAVDDGEPVLIKLPRATLELREFVVLPGENPAHRIIKRVYANRKVNDGMRYRRHRYTSYSKTIFTGAVDSALLRDPERLAKLDSSDKETIDFFDDQHILLIESATAKSFIPPAAEKEQVLAMRVSGLKDPSLLALAASTRTFSIYDASILVNEKNYVSPIGPTSTNQYFFLLQDTLYQGADTVFIISYEPRQGKKFDALRGVLYVNTDGYAVQNVIAEPVERSGGMSLKLQQQHKHVGGASGGWFPVQLNTFMYFDFVDMDNFKLMGIGRTYLKDIELDADIARKEVRGPDFVLDKLAARRDEDYWAALRNDTLDARELRTYHVIDSISEAEHIEQKVKWFSYLTTGRMPVGPIDIRLNQIFAYNGYEGLRLGVGAATNDKVTRYASLGGYVAYGFADARWKYGGDLTIKPRPGRDVEVKGYYANDVAESGGVAFNSKPILLSTEGYRWFFVDRMDRIERIGAELAFRVSNSVRLWVGTERADRLNVIGYQYADPRGEGVTVLTDRFLTGGVSAGLRFAFRERMARLPDRQISLGTRWPVLQINAFRSFKGLWEGDVETWRVNAMIEKTFRVRMLGDLSIRVMGGVADDQAPYPFLFDLRGTYSTKLPLATANTFETMRPNEFLADRYATVMVQHSFGHLLFKGGKFQPIPVLVANAGWGGLSEPQLHRGSTFKPLDQGYYEAGLRVDNLFKLGFTSFGVGAFYRLGPLALEDPMDNLAVKLSLSLGF
ncbi:MAG: DUF5686 family protein [Flavobacteriales bacterium]